MKLDAWFIEEMRAVLGEDAEALFAALEGTPSRSVRRNGMKIGREAFESLFPDLEPIPYTDDGYYDDGRFHGRDVAHCAGLYYIQEPSAQLPVSLLQGLHFTRALDLCAAPGGKSGKLAELADVLYSNEVVYKRTGALLSNLERLGVRNAVVTCNRPDDYAAAYPAAFDLVLVDAPCSGEGMFRKEPEAIAAHSRAAVEACAVRQAAILNSAAACVCGGGYLLYSTCTFNRLENEGVLQTFLSRHADFSTVPLPEHLRNVGLASPLSGGIRLMPQFTRGEGQFACLMRRDGDGTPSGKVAPYGNKVKRNDWRKVYDEVSRVSPWLTPTELRGKVVLAPQVLGGVNILSAGVPVVALEQTPRPLHSLAMALRYGETAQSIDFPFGAKELAAYLKGNELSAQFKGWGTVTANGYPLGLVKASCGVAKNHYPKGLLLFGPTSF